MQKSTNRLKLALCFKKDHSYRLGKSFLLSHETQTLHLQKQSAIFWKIMPTCLAKINFRLLNFYSGIYTLLYKQKMILFSASDNTYHIQKILCI